ncbi:hypothetical protein SLEP1_g20595 [Rubroshorea leprosula]|uniref:Uncharacterized protein n=1 Tax=Rubroshorea leprosula TaxID=152421 RepID=A0AAV5JDR7_9ROSI|nr:hypothetical protein SLEP1_g20595 [Rubroshorea leprosula]
MLLQTTVSTPLPFPPPPLSHSLHSSGSLKIRPKKLSLQCYGVPALKNLTTYEVFPSFQADISKGSGHGVCSLNKI